jgi:hypothetical protein
MKNAIFFCKLDLVFYSSSLLLVLGRGFFDETKLIGIFSSKEKAEKAIEEYKKISGFKNYPENFYIDQYELDKRHWEEGVITWEETMDRN